MSTRRSDAAINFDLAAGALFLCLLLLALLGGLCYLFFLRPDLIVEGTFLTAFSAIAVAVYSRFAAFRSLVRRYFSRLLFFIDANRLAVLVASSVLILASLIVFTAMFSEYLNRYHYVKAIQDSIRNDTFESRTMPDPEVLADAFLMYPERSEVPLLLLRASRLFHFADDKQRFQSYQNAFVGKVVDAIEAGTLDLCALDTREYDPVIFVALAYAETAYTALDDAGDATAAERRVRAVERAVEFLRRCPSTSIERRIYILKMKEAVSGHPAASPGFDLGTELAAIRSDIDALKPGEAANLYRRHAYQEYEDFLAYLALADAVRFARGLADTGKPFDDEARQQLGALMDTVATRYRKILMLRGALGRAGTVVWHTTPSKLSLYHRFADRYGFDSHVTRGVLAELDALTDSPAKAMINDALRGVVESEAFSEYRRPAAWNRSSPLDPDLAGDALNAKLNDWLQRNW